MKILLIGGTGQVGSEILHVAEINNINCVSPSSSELNIADRDSVFRIIESNLPVDFIINASAYTAVDKAEDELELANSINRDGPQFLAEACAHYKLPLLHISTDYVFDGKASSPYKEDAPTHPLGVYGKSKLEGEQVLCEALPEHIILRTAWVYGANGNNFVKTMLRLGQQHSELRVVNDQFGCPTAAVDIAETIVSIITQMHTQPNQRWGVYHYCSGDSTNWADFAKAIFEQAKAVDPDYPAVDVKPIPASEYPTKAARPNYSVLDCSKTEQFFAVKLPLWHSSLQRDISNILKNI